MKTTLDFSFENDMTLEELENEARAYPLIIQRAYRSDSAGAPRYDMDAIDAAMLNTNIAILYKYYEKGVLGDAMKLFEIYFWRDEPPKGSRYAVTWGGVERQRKTMARVCGMLSELGIDRIASTQEMTDLYHELTEIIDRSRKEERRDTVLCDLEFWELFFAFHDKYWAK